MELLSGATHWRYLKYALMAQFYAVLALDFYYIVPASYPLLAASGALFALGLLMLVHRALVPLLRQNMVLTWAAIYFVEALSMWMYFRNATFTTHFFDLGNFMQPLYMTLYGHQLFALNISPTAFQLVSVSPINLNAPNSVPLLSTLFSPLLFLLLPFYAIYPSALTLFVIQNIAMALPAFFIFGLIEDKKKQLWVALLYLGYAPIYFVAFWDFHTEAFFPLFLFLVIYSMVRGNRKWFYTGVALFLSVNQAGPALLAFLLPYVYHKTRNIKMVVLPGLMALGFAATAFLVTGNVLGDRMFLQPSGGTILSSTLQGLGGKLTYTTFLFAPVLFVPLLQPLALLPAAAWLGYAFLRNFFPYTSILFQYNMLVVGFVFLGLVGSVKYIDSRLLKVGLVISLVVFVASWPQGSPYIAGAELPYSNPAYPELNAILRQIPSNATIMASDSVFPALANRVGTYFDPNFPPQWIVLEKSDNNIQIQQPYVNYYLSIANYTIIENDSLLFVARLNTG